MSIWPAKTYKPSAERGRRAERNPSTDDHIIPALKVMVPGRALNTAGVCVKCEIWGTIELMGRGGKFATYLTRFCVHSRSRLVSRATLTPSEKFERAPFRRRWASACSSMSSRCLAFNWPELLRAAVLVLVRADFKTREISRLFTSIEISKAEYILTFALAWQVPGPMAWGQKCPACGHSEHRQRRLPNTIQCWTHSRR